MGTGFKTKKFEYLIYLLIFTPIISIVLFTGFTVDDWGQLSMDTTLQDQISNWRELWSYRPVSWLVIPTIVQLFNDNHLVISLVHMTLLTFSLWQVSNWSRLCLSKEQKSFARLLLFAPAMASTTFISPINQFSCSLSMFFFGIAIKLEDRITRFKRLFVLLMFLASLLSYEITLPLIIAYYLFNIYYDRHPFKDLFAAVSLISFLIFWQKIIAPIMLSSGNSRISTLSIFSGLSFLFSTFVSYPLSLILFLPVLTILTLIASAYMLLNWSKVSEVQSSLPSHHRRFILIVLVVSLFSSSLLFIVSGRVSEINGYGNRGMLSVWIIVSLIMTVSWERNRRLRNGFLIWILLLNYAVHIDKVIQAVEVSNIRKSIVTQISQLEIFKSSSPKTLILDLPCTVPGDKFRLEVFCTEWDARGALENRGVEVQSVSVTGDQGMLTKWVEGYAPSNSYGIWFDSKYQLKKVLKLDLVGSSGLVELKELASANYAKVVRDQQSCVFQAKKIFNFESGIKLREIIRCASDPFAN